MPHQGQVIMNYYDEPGMIRVAITGMSLGLLFVLFFIIFNACTFSITNVMTKGVASDLVDEEQGASADLKADVPMIP